MNKVNKYDIEYEIARVYPFTRCDEYAHAWECEQASVYSYYSKYLEYYKNGEITDERIKEWLTCIYSPSDCGYYNYPDFTAEKQLKIIKLLSKIRGDIQLCYIANQYIFVVNFETSKCQWANKYHDKLDEALADMVNVLWQSLPDKDKEEIRGILK